MFRNMLRSASNARIDARRTRRCRAVPSLQTLEGRALLAVDVSVSGNVLELTSDGAGDHVEVRQNAADNFAVDVVVKGVATETHPLGVNGTIVFHGNGGNDTFINNTYNPTVRYSRAATAYGDAGTDWLQGNDRNDVLIGGTGIDTLTGGAGNDFLSGEAGDDHLYGAEGHDFLVGGGGNDTLYGHAGNDLLYGADGGDLLDGGDGNDFLDAGLIDDGMSNTLFGGSGEDDLFSSVYGADALYGGGNDDHFMIRISSVYADPVLAYAMRVNQVVEDGQPGDVVSLGGVY